MEEYKEAQLLMLMRDDIAEGPPPAYDIKIAMRTGNRVRRTHAAAGSLAAVVAVALVVAGSVLVHDATRDRATNRPGTAPTLATPALAVADCTVSVLPLPPGATWDDTDPTGYVPEGTVLGDPSGHYVLEILTALGPPNRSKATLWHDGEARMLPGSTTHGNWGTAVNSHGVVIGGGGNGADPSAYVQPWVYQDGNMRNLIGPAGQHATPLAINTAGDIVASTDSGAIVWPAGQTSTWKSVPGGDGGSLRTPARLTIDDDGTIAGIIGGVPMIWHPTATSWTPAPLPTGPWTRFDTLTIRDGHLAGNVVVPDPTGGGSTTMPVVWANAEANPVAASFPYGGLYAIAANGDAVGASPDSPQDLSHGYGLLYRDGVAERLPSLPDSQLPAYFHNGLPVDSGGRTSSISDDGHQIFGITALEIPIEWHC